MPSWDAFSSLAWEFLNSDFGVALVTIVAGGWLANRIAAAWQRRNIRYELQLKLYERLQTSYVEWVKAGAVKKEEFEAMIALVNALHTAENLFESKETMASLRALQDVVLRSDDQKHRKPKPFYDAVLRGLARELGIRRPKGKTEKGESNDG
jgi:hypothetical protein